MAGLLAQHHRLLPPSRPLRNSGIEGGASALQWRDRAGIQPASLLSLQHAAKHHKAFIQLKKSYHILSLSDIDFGEH
ncbi:hypothetical protein B14911_27555 [Bacillus sp. NRRL B-14911]|nr:hypothetical protein B14911_27555 [Bacillus sp. NRRL B-14911]